MSPTDYLCLFVYKALYIDIIYIFLSSYSFLLGYNNIYKIVPYIVLQRNIMAQSLVKINISNRNCKGLYFVDSNGTYSGVKELTNTNAPKRLKEDFKLVLRLTANGRTKKETFNYPKTKTLLQAIDDVTTKRTTVFESKEKASKLPTLGEYWDEYTEYKENTVSAKESWRPTTAKDMKSFYNAWIKPSKLHKMLLVEIERDHVEALIAKVKRERSLRTAKKVTEALAPLFKRYYTANNIHELNPASIDIGDLNNVREVIVSLKEAKALYDAMFNYPIEKYRNVFVWLATGRRLGEVLALSTAAVNMEKKQFDVIPENSKSGKKLTFILRPELEETLEGKDGLIHPSHKGTIMDGSTIRKHWKKITESIGREDLHMHDIRHIIGTVLRDSGVGEDIRALVLGHTRSSVTARYATANAELADEVYQFFMDKLDGKIIPKAKWTEVK